MWMDFFFRHVPLAKKKHHWPTWKWGLSVINIPENPTQIRLCLKATPPNCQLGLRGDVSTQLEMASICWQIKTMGKSQKFTVKSC
jgi:hypothetical protein